MKVTFALALNEDGIFEKRHFGDSDKFAIYIFRGQELSFREELPNTFKSLDVVHKDGSKTKGEAIISFLKEKGVSVLVSKQFGQNINMVNQHFVPVIIAEDKTEHVLEILQKHIGWFKDELTIRNGSYMLFYIKNGIIKMRVKKLSLK